MEHEKICNCEKTNDYLYYISKYGKFTNSLDMLLYLKNNRGDER